MRNLLLLAMLATLGVAPASARRGCEAAEGAGPTAAQLEGCWSRDLYDLLVARLGPEARLGVKSCLSGRNQEVVYQVAMDGLEIRCESGSLHRAIATLSDAELALGGLTVVPTGLSPSQPQARLARLSQLKPKDVRSLSGEALLRAFDGAAVPDAVVADAVSMYAREVSREIQAERIQSWMKDAPSFQPVSPGMSETLHPPR